MVVILGPVFKEEYEVLYNRKNEKTKHFDIRRDRLGLVLENAKPLFYFEVLRESGRQVHVLYEDAVLLVFNKETCKIITVILPSRRTLYKYFRAVNDYPSEHPYTQRCAKIHEKNIKKWEELSPEEVLDLRALKMRHLRMKD